MPVMTGSLLVDDEFIKQNFCIWFGGLGVEQKRCKYLNNTVKKDVRKNIWFTEINGVWRNAPIKS
jgi:hypothetical protein